MAKVETTRNVLKKKGLSLPTGTKHVIVVTRPRLHVLDLEDSHFNFDRSIVLPDLARVDGSVPVLDERRVTGLGVILAALVHVKGNPAQRIIVAGHADTAGSVEYNQTLTERRAENAFTLLTGDRERWRLLSDQESHPDDIQRILAWQAAAAGWDCDPGNIRGAMNAATTSAVRRFQERYNLEVDSAATAGRDSPFKTKVRVDGDPGPETWGAFFDVYMVGLMRLLQIDTTVALREHQARVLAFDDQPAFVGCSEHHPFDEARREGFAGDETERPPNNPPDRRVELLFCDPDEKPDLVCHAQAQCKPDICPLYHKRGFVHRPIGIPKGLQLLEVVVQFLVLDAEGNKIPLPEGFDVEVRFDDGTTLFEFLRADGILQFEIARDKDKFSFVLDGGLFSHVVVETADGAVRTSRGTEEEALAGFERGGRFFMLPSELASREAVWQVPPAIAFVDGEFINLRDPRTEVGQRGAPAQLVLEPLWQHLRFDYFDVWHGTGGTLPQPRPVAEGTQPIVLQGFRDRGPNLVLDEGQKEAEAIWDLVREDETIHCIPWIRRRVFVKVDSDDNGHDDLQGIPVTGPGEVYFPLPSTRSTTAWQLAPNTFIRSQGAPGSASKDRLLETIGSGHAREGEVGAPGVARLRYVDLPEQWQSLHYFARRQGDAAGTRVQFETLGPTAATNPAIIDLDDIVLCNHAGPNPFDESAPPFAPAGSLPLSDSDDERFTIYDEGLHPYKNDAGEPYFTKASSLSLAPQAPVLLDHPRITRLVTVGKDVFECFAERTAPARVFENHPIGARAAVNWRSKHHSPFVSFDGNYESPRANDTKPDRATVGNSVTLVLRCCGHEGDVEIFRVVQYASVLLDFPAAPPKGTAVMPTPTPGQIRTKTRDSLIKTAARWNGLDEFNGHPFEFEVKEGDAVTAKGRYHAILVRGGPKTHRYKFDIVEDVRASMFLVSLWEPDDLVSAAGGRFTAAHEWGHGFGLPDEYIENQNNASLQADGISDAFRSPGCPYSFDPKGMMATNVSPRAHSMWHLALWMSEEKHTFAGKTAWSVIHGAHRYAPKHTAPKDSRTRIPVFSRVNATAGARGLFDIFAYAVGADGFNAGDALHGATLTAPFDLIVIVRVKMAWSLIAEDHADYEDGRKLLARVSDTLHVAFNRVRRVLAHGTFEGRAVRARLLFSPRFISRKFPSGSSTERTEYLDNLDFDPKQETDYIVFVNDLVAEHGVHCEVTAIQDPDPGGFTVSSGPKREATVDTEDIDDEIINVFGQLVGLAKPTTENPEDFAPLVDLISGFSRGASNSMEFVE